MRWLDRTLLNALQRGCDWITQRTRVTKFTLEKWSLLLIVISFVAAAIVNLNAVGIIVTVVLVIFGVSLIRDIEANEAIFLEYNTSWSSSWEDPWKRMVMLPTVFFLIIVLALLPVKNDTQELVRGFFLVATLFVIAWGYVAACVPRLPTKT